MIKGIVIGAVGMYIYLVQPEWASSIIEFVSNTYNSIMANIQNEQ
jgi:hypothetical protein